MLKYPWPGCGVVIAPDRGVEDLPQQKGALIRHLEGVESVWWKCKGHDLNHDTAKAITEHVAEITNLLRDVR
jgi:hypothetical protein